MCVRKAGATDRPKRVVLSGTRQRRLVGETLPYCPLARRGAARLCSGALLGSAGGGGGWVKGEQPCGVPDRGVRARHACGATAPKPFARQFPVLSAKQPNPTSSGLRATVALSQLSGVNGLVVSPP